MQTQSRFIPGHLHFILPTLALIVIVSFTLTHVSRNATATTPDRRMSSTHPILQPAALIQVADSETNAHMNSTYGKLPISFVLNSGQTDMRVKFTAQGKGYRAFLTGDGAVISLHSGPLDPIMKTRNSPPGAAARTPTLAAGKAAALHIRLLGANPETEVAGAEKLQGVSNYYIGNDPKKWRTNVPMYAQVRYRSVYPGIDLLYYGNEGWLEHDFVVAPGAEPNAIAMEIEGAGGVELTAAGDLRLKTDVGDVSLLNPTVYQVINHEKRKIEARYVVAVNKEVRFHIGEYDRTQPLIIDPVLRYSTLLGGSNFDYGMAIALDSSRNAYVAGQTTSSDFPLKNAFYSVPGVA